MRGREAPEDGATGRLVRRSNLVILVTLKKGNHMGEA